MTLTPDAGIAAQRLRSGPNGLPRLQVVEIQRARMLAAAVDAVGEVGYARMSVAQVVARARGSRKTFYDVFADREACFLAAFEQTFSEATQLAREAYEGESSWREGVRSALSRLLRLVDEQPSRGRLVLVESLAAGSSVLRRRAQMLDEFAQMIDDARSLTDTGCEPPRLTAEGIVGGVVALLYTRLLEHRSEPASDLLAPVMSMIVLPYLGASAARHELNRPTPPSRRRRGARRPQPSNGLEDLHKRLTYRTILVLTAIAQHAGASNRTVAECSGIVDQGQISKLLARLAALDLVENRGEGQVNGAPNAWHLTPLGAQLERAARLR